MKYNLPSLTFRTLLSSPSQSSQAYLLLLATPHPILGNPKYSSVFDASMSSHLCLEYPSPLLFLVNPESFSTAQLNCHLLCEAGCEFHQQQFRSIALYIDLYYWNSLPRLLMRTQTMSYSSLCSWSRKHGRYTMNIC